MTHKEEAMKIVYVVGGLLAPNGMSSVLSAKINYLAEHTDYELYMILTEKAGAARNFLPGSPILMRTKQK